MPKPLPLGEVALRSNDGEGKPGTKEPLRSDKQASLSERYYRAVQSCLAASLPSQALRASSPKGGALGMSVRSMLDEQSTMSRKR